MKIFSLLVYWLILAFTCTTNIYANSELNFSYTYEGKRSDGFSLDLYELSSLFEEKNFTRLSSFPSGNIPMINADEVMYSPSHKGSIFIKLGLLAPLDKRFKILKGEGFYLYHTDTASVAFFDFSREEVLELSRKLQPSRVVKMEILDLFLGRAEASDQIGNCQVPPKNIFNDIEMITGNLSYTMLLKKMGECGVNALKGMDGGIEKINSFFTMLKDDPAKLWRNMKESYENMKYLVTNLTSELQKIFESMRFLSVNEMLEIGCTMAGEAVPGLALMATGVGIAAGTTRILLTVLPKLQRLQRLMAMHRRFKAPTKGLQEALSCAL